MNSVVPCILLNLISCRQISPLLTPHMLQLNIVGIFYWVCGLLKNKNKSCRGRGILETITMPYEIRWAFLTLTCVIQLLQLAKLSLGLVHTTLRRMFLLLWWIFGATPMKSMLHYICLQRMNSFLLIFPFVLMIIQKILTMWSLRNVYLMSHIWSYGTSLIEISNFRVQTRISESTWRVDTTMSGAVCCWNSSYTF